MEECLATWLHQQYGTVVDLFYAHGLRQGPETTGSTGFDVHQDTEDYDFIQYTVVVKLTPDERGEPPSAMVVVGAEREFQYGPAAGAAGCFRARLYHASVPPVSSAEHLKIAFFFRADPQGERRVDRALRQSRAAHRRGVASSDAANGSTDGSMDAAPAAVSGILEPSRGRRSASAAPLPPSSRAAARGETVRPVARTAPAEACSAAQDWLPAAPLGPSAAAVTTHSSAAADADGARAMASQSRAALAHRQLVMRASHLAEMERLVDSNRALAKQLAGAGGRASGLTSAGGTDERGAHGWGLARGPPEPAARSASTTTAASTATSSRSLEVGRVSKRRPSERAEGEAVAPAEEAELRYNCRKCGGCKRFKASHCGQPCSQVLPSVQGEPSELPAANGARLALPTAEATGAEAASTEVASGRATDAVITQAAVSPAPLSALPGAAADDDFDVTDGETDDEGM